MARNKYPEETVNRIVDVALRLFLQKGYENTSIQDILDELGDLSKGAIYHHFKSKAEILEAVGVKIGEKNIALLQEIRDDAAMTGYQKLQAIFRSALSDPNQKLTFTLVPNMMDNPQFLSMQLQEIFQETAPKYLQPIIEQGVADGSIQTEYPKELAEAILILCNIWLNPMIILEDVEATIRKCRLFNQLFSHIGLNLVDEDMILQFAEICQYVQRKPGKRDKKRPPTGSQEA